MLLSLHLLQEAKIQVTFEVPDIYQHSALVEANYGAICYSAPQHHILCLLPWISKLHIHAEVQKVTAHVCEHEAEACRQKCVIVSTTQLSTVLFWRPGYYSKTPCCCKRNAAGSNIIAVCWHSCAACGGLLCISRPRHLGIFGTIHSWLTMRTWDAGNTDCFAAGTILLLHLRLHALS